MVCNKYICFVLHLRLFYVNFINFELITENQIKLKEYITSTCVNPIVNLTWVEDSTYMIS